MQILLANPRGFCAGVERAISIVERALEKFGAPIYVRHEVVHNRFVVDGLRAKGAIFVHELDEVPDGATVIFSAHGVPKSVRAEAARRHLTVFDATCPLVTKVHFEVERHRKAGREVIMIGHKGHPEVEGTMGQWPDGMYLVENVADVATLKVGAGGNEDVPPGADSPRKVGAGGAAPPAPPLAYVTQTTLSVDDAAAIVAALKCRFPNIVGPKKDDICYATQNRQDAVRRLAQQCDVILVVGSKNSSNSNRLREVAEQQGAQAWLIDRAAELRPEWFADAAAVGITAGASAPETLVAEVVAAVAALTGAPPPKIAQVDEGVRFPLPKGLG
ncbi:4-hydroxy-3-methylbut-2-enyl diphosphate reductase [Sulfuricystis multivorans]|uniref:4-hydroxy-3-methylbut-2-enyl diphosphate reductase n=1 Tax=Sulfuricystis multivorans TaxID=2211108 RepID=UPI000F847848|nr:4-hydroxy-3-methylbut-2-enyl diphosphate reductase [Sulfuricystis multivorans]